MTTFAPQTVRVAAPDPFKHVNYTQGMVLGVDDFNQEFAYLAGHDQWITRDLLGYGTVCGLRVFPRRAGSEGWEIVVEAGTAVNPRGEWIRVPTAQCARLRSWIDAHDTDVQRYAVGQEVRVYVVLCYRECKVDLVPIPGEPCRSEDASFAESRVQDDYTLELSFTPPRQRQEDAIRDFGLWLSQIEIEDIPDSQENQAAFLAAVRNAVPQLQSPPASPPTSPPDYMLGSPPVDLRIPRAAFYEYLRTAFRIWVTELRPLWLGTNQTCDGLPPDDRCVLLAEATIPLTVDGLLSDADDVTLNEEQRPYLLSLRMVQEWLMRRLEVVEDIVTSPPSDLPDLAGDAEGALTANIVTGLYGQPIVEPNGDPTDENNNIGHLLSYMGAGWQLVPPPEGTPELPDLDGDVVDTPTNNRVVRLQGRELIAPTAAQTDHVLGFNGSQWQVIPRPIVPPAVTYSGDLDTTTPAATRVTGLHGREIVAPTVGQTNHVLGYNGTRWQLVPRPVTPTIPPQFIVAAGRFDPGGGTVFDFNKLVARRIDFLNATLYFLTFPGIAERGNYVIKATIVNSLRGQPCFIEAIELQEDPLRDELIPLIEEFNSQGPEFPIEIDVDLVVRVTPEVRNTRMRGFMIEISDFS